MSREERSSRSATRRAFFVSQWFPPEPATQALRIAKTMRSLGYATEVITGIPNYPTGIVAEGYRATSVRTETIEGLRVHRSPLYPSHDSRAARRILNYVSWAVSASILSAWRLRRADVVLVYSSPATAALPAMIANRVFRTPYVLLIQDVWPDSVFSSGFLDGRLMRATRAAIDLFVKASYRWAAQIAVISPGMFDLLSSRGVPEDKLSVIFNSVDTRIFGSADSTIFRSSLGVEEDSFVLMYAGNHGAAQGLETLIQGVGLAKTSQATHLVMVGDGVDKPRLRDLAKVAAPGRVHFVDPQPRESMQSLMGIADAQVLSLSRHPLFAVTIPSKLQGMMASGEPVLAVAAGDVRRVIAEAECGVTARPGDEQDVARSIEELASLSREGLAEMGERGQRFYQKNMSNQVGKTRLERVLKRARRESPAAASPRRLPGEERVRKSAGPGSQHRI